MGWQDIYRQKLLSVEDAAGMIKSNDRIWYPMCSSAPVNLIDAITNRYQQLDNVTMFSCLILYPFEYLKKKYIGHIKHHTAFMGPIERKWFSEGNMEITSYQFSQTDWLMRNRVQPNVLIMEVSPPDANGNMSYGPMGTFSNDVVAQCATIIIAQVNDQVPYVLGNKESYINVRDVTYICEAHHPIAELLQPPISDVDKTIASHMVDYIENGSTIQIGLGGVANAIGFFLKNHQDLGVHTEMLTDSMVTLIEKGVINGSKKNFNPGEVTCSFGLGSAKLYKFIDRNPMIKVYPIAYIANDYNIAKNDKFISINNALMCDLTGQVCAESLGFDQFSGTGGQLDFVRGAGMSQGGKSFIAFRSVAKKKDGMLISRITSVLPPGAVVTTPRTDVQYVVTEYGIAELRNKSFSERAKALISIAHPQFRENLLKEARQYHLIV